MKKDNATFKLMAGYLLILLLLLMSNKANGQSPCENDDLCVVQFNAGFNEANKVTWIDELNDCNTKFIDIQLKNEKIITNIIIIIPNLFVFTNR